VSSPEEKKEGYGGKDLQERKVGLYNMHGKLTVKFGRTVLEIRGQTDRDRQIYSSSSQYSAPIYWARSNDQERAGAKVINKVKVALLDYRANIGFRR